MIELDRKDRIGGLSITVNLGEVVSINDGAVLIQIVGVSRNRLKLKIESDPNKFKVDRQWSHKPKGKNDA